jgi:hypothetical protein
MDSFNEIGKVKCMDWRREGEAEENLQILELKFFRID